MRQSAYLPPVLPGEQTKHRSTHRVVSHLLESPSVQLLAVSTQLLGSDRYPVLTSGSMVEGQLVERENGGSSPRTTDR